MGATLQRHCTVAYEKWDPEERLKVDIYTASFEQSECSTWAFVIVYSDVEVSSRSGTCFGARGRAELSAILMALRYAPTNHNVTIFSDSYYAVLMANNNHTYDENQDIIDEIRKRICEGVEVAYMAPPETNKHKRHADELVRRKTDKHKKVVGRL